MCSVAAMCKLLRHVSLKKDFVTHHVLNMLNFVLAVFYDVAIILTNFNNLSERQTCGVLEIKDITEFSIFPGKVNVLVL